MILLLSLLVCSCLLSTVHSITCIGDDGIEVDWFALFKKPVIHGGFEYFYSSSGTVGQMVEGQHDMNSLNNPFAATLNPIYSRQIGLNYIIYNDSPPPKSLESPGRGHTKGVVMWDSTTLVWIVHSIPSFPPVRRGSRQAKYSFPSTAKKNGQTGLCMSLKVTDLDAVSNQLYFNWPYICDHNVAPEFNTGTLAMVLRGQEKTDLPLTGRVKLNSKSMEFISYAKTGTWGRDLYHDLVAPLEKTSLIVNTWQNGVSVRDKLPSDCSPPYNVLNTDTIEIMGEEWSSTQDHSKYVISYTEGEKPGEEKAFLFCIGDINRVASQMRRGGGTVCFRNKQLWNDGGLLAYISCSGYSRTEL